MGRRAIDCLAELGWRLERHVLWPAADGARALRLRLGDTRLLAATAAAALVLAAALGVLPASLPGTEADSPGHGWAAPADPRAEAVALRYTRRWADRVRGKERITEAGVLSAVATRRARRQLLAERARPRAARGLALVDFEVREAGAESAIAAARMTSPGHELLLRLRIELQGARWLVSSAQVDRGG